MSGTWQILELSKKIAFDNYVWVSNYLVGDISKLLCVMEFFRLLQYTGYIQSNAVLVIVMEKRCHFMLDHFMCHFMLHFNWLDHRQSLVMKPSFTEQLALCNKGLPIWSYDERFCHNSSMMVIFVRQPKAVQCIPCALGEKKKETFWAFYISCSLFIESAFIKTL